MELAALPLSMRGFGHVKERNVAAARKREALLLQRLATPAQVVRLQEGAAG